MPEDDYIGCMVGQSVEANRQWHCHLCARPCGETAPNYVPCEQCKVVAVVCDSCMCPGSDPRIIKHGGTRDR